MPAGRPGPGQDDGPVEGPPSARAQASLAADLRREVADARARLEEAGLRAEAHRLLGDDVGAADVVREQEAILVEVQDRLGRAVSAAVVQRDAEQVLADLTDVHAAGEAVPSTGPSRGASPHDAGRGTTGHRRAPALTGVASMVAVLGVVAAAVLGLTRGLAPVAVDEVSADAVPRVGVDAGAVSPAPPPGASAGPAAGPEAGRANSFAFPGAPRTPTAPTATHSTAPSDGPGEQQPAPAPVPDLGTVVRDLIDAVAGLGTPGPTDPPSDVDASVPDVEDLVEDRTPDPAPEPTGTRGGFVQDPPAQ